jgi:hypothetical protein
MNLGAIVRNSIIVNPNLWNCNILPEGILEDWLAVDGSHVDAGETIAKVRIEDSVHDLTAPATGTLRVGARINSVVEPGSVIGEIVRDASKPHLFEDEA